MTDPSTDAPLFDGWSRRQVLQRGAVVGVAGALWATPVVQTIGMRPAAASPINGEDEDEFGSVCRGRPDAMKLSILPSDCTLEPLAGDQVDSFNDNDQGVTWDPSDDRTNELQDCSGELPASAVRFEVIMARSVSDLTSSSPAQEPSEPIFVDAGQPFHAYLFEPGQAGHTNGVPPNLAFQITALNSDGYEVHDANNEPIVQRFAFHTSCSQPLREGWRFGSVVIEELIYDSDPDDDDQAETTEEENLEEQNLEEQSVEQESLDGTGSGQQTMTDEPQVGGESTGGLGEGAGTDEGALTGEGAATGEGALTGEGAGTDEGALTGEGAGTGEGALTDEGALTGEGEITPTG